jgi:hypothetical protein
VPKFRRNARRFASSARRWLRRFSLLVVKATIALHALHPQQLGRVGLEIDTSDPRSLDLIAVQANAARVIQLKLMAARSARYRG